MQSHYLNTFVVIAVLSLLFAVYAIPVISVPHNEAMIPLPNASILFLLGVCIVGLAAFRRK